MAYDAFHEPILLTEVLNAIPLSTRVIVDGTLGHGWHTQAIATSGRFVHLEEMIGCDRDVAMIAKAHERLTQHHISCDSHHRSYADIIDILQQKNIKADFILLDIGVNMEHFKDVERGFSIKGDAPLDMRYDVTGVLTAAKLINTRSRSALVDLFVSYADLRPVNAEKLVREILETRSKAPIQMTMQFKEVAKRVWYGEKACAVLFQAIRIGVNNELGEFKQFLETLPEVLAPGARCAIITYHSGEDTIAKHALQYREDQWMGRRINKKVIIPTYQEQQRNKASRSAKLRVWERA